MPAAPEPKRAAPEPTRGAPEPTRAAPPARPDFSFGDLDFEEPTGSPANQTQIFGESSGPQNADTVLATLPARKAMPRASFDERAPNAPLADPLYSKTRFLDPHAPSDVVPRFDTPLPTMAPPLPDLLGIEDTAPSQSLSEIELSDAESEPEIEAERIDETDPLAEPFSPDTSAALEDPEFAPVARTRSTGAPALAATRLAFDAGPRKSRDDLDVEPDLVDAEALPADAMPEPPAELDDWSAIRAPAERDLRPTAPLPSRPQTAVQPHVSAPMIDSALLAQTLEKVAWEAFGSISEQVVNEVKKRVEAVVWEVVPQMCERVIREEIARLKAELPE